VTGVRFLFVDRILEVEPGRRILASKLVTMADGYLVTHHSPRPSMPAGILLECMAQVGGDLNLLTRGLKVQTLLVAIDGLRIHRLPHPGETLLIELRMERAYTEGASVTGSVRIGSEVVATLDRMMYVQQRSDDMKYFRRQNARMDALMVPRSVHASPSSAQPSPVLQPLG
jgi:3-hydroxyacyl-[acyl-carrier-protein] dehydratase